MLEQFVPAVLNSRHGQDELVGWCVVLVKKAPSVSLPLDLIVQLPQQVRVIRDSDGLALLKVVHEENTLRVPEDNSHDLACRLHHLGLPWSWRTVMP